MYLFLDEDLCMTYARTHMYDFCEHMPLMAMASCAGDRHAFGQKNTAN